MSIFSLDHRIQDNSKKWSYSILGMVFLLIGGLPQNQLCSSLAIAESSLEVFPLFTDHSVLQRELDLPIWGWDNPGQEVTVTLNGLAEKATAEKESGRWQVTFPPMGAGGPYEMKVVGTATLTFSDILVGDLWVCSGQSNMEWPLVYTDNWDQVRPNLNNDQLRLFYIGHAAAPFEKKTVDTLWRPADEENTKMFSAIAYHFGATLNKELGVPIGVIATSWGGTRAEPWTPREALLSSETFSPRIKEIDESMNPAVMKKRLDTFMATYNQWILDNAPASPQDKGESAGWFQKDFDDSEWNLVKQPGYWEDFNSPRDGVLWFRHEVELPKEWEGQAIRLNLGPIDDFDTTWFNGKKVGRTDMRTSDWWTAWRKYEIPGELVKGGMNHFTIRIEDYLAAGGLYAQPSEVYIELVDKGVSSETVNIAGEWKYAVELLLPGVHGLPPQPFYDPYESPSSPSRLYNAMIAPLVPCAMKGVIWYQGESNANEWNEYHELFSLLIKGWRQEWKRDFPFLFVQLAPFGSENVTNDSTWAKLRESQLKTMQSVDNTAMVVITDYGNCADIHPKQKQPVAERLALAARHFAYGDEQVVYSGPVFDRVESEGGKLKVYFTHLHDGLKFEGDSLQGAYVAGEDHVFYPATGTLEGEALFLESEKVETPVAVRYGWADCPKVNLFNKNGLPATPFRSDQWEKAEMK